MCLNERVQKLENVYAVTWQDEDGVWHTRWVQALDERAARQQGYALSLGAFVHIQRARYTVRAPALRQAA